MIKIVRISGAFQILRPNDLYQEILYQTRDMDSIVSIEELPRTSDTRKFRIIGTPK
jgi:hypothetical protein